jgi:transcriptional regulator with XRE-family HTH domain
MPVEEFGGSTFDEYQRAYSVLAGQLETIMGTVQSNRHLWIRPARLITQCAPGHCGCACHRVEDNAAILSSETQLDAEEGFVLDATELVAEAMNERKWTKTQLAQALGVRESEVVKRLQGRRNLTLRNFAAMLHVLGYDVQLKKHSHQTEKPVPFMEAHANSRIRDVVQGSSNEDAITRADIEAAQVDGNIRAWAEVDIRPEEED